MICTAAPRQATVNSQRVAKKKKRRRGPVSSASTHFRVLMISAGEDVGSTEVRAIPFFDRTSTRLRSLSSLSLLRTANKKEPRRLELHPRFHSREGARGRYRNSLVTAMGPTSGSYPRKLMCAGRRSQTHRKREGLISNILIQYFISS